MRIESESEDFNLNENHSHPHSHSQAQNDNKMRGEGGMGGRFSCIQPQKFTWQKFLETWPHYT